MDKKWYRTQPLPADIAQRVEQLPTLLAENDVQLAYLFGSLAQRATGNDVDLALLLPPDQPPYRLRDKLTAFLNTERVDIADLRRASNVLRFEVIKYGRCLYARDDMQKQAFELETVRAYHDREIPRRHQEAILRERMKWLSSAEPSSND